MLSVQPLRFVTFLVIAAALSSCGIRKSDSRVTAIPQPTAKLPDGGDVNPTVAPQAFPTVTSPNYLSCTGLTQEDTPDESIAADEVQDLCNTLTLLSFSSNPTNDADDPLDF